MSLDPFFNPKSIAIIGAKDTPGSVARTIQQNLIIGGFTGTLYPINPHRKEVLGIKAFPLLPEAVDLAIIVTPAKTVPAIIAQCIEKGVKAAIVISAGFKELGDAGARLERELLETAQKGEMLIIGPNCLGLINPIEHLNASFAKGMALAGHVAFLSQSGALCTAVLDWSFRENIGFSAFVSVGSMVDIGWADLIDHFGRDPNTQSILIYMETIGDAASFLAAARRTALKKPIIVIKPGRTPAAAKAAASHTGSMTGDDLVFDAAMESVGVLRVDTIAELFSFAEALAKQPLPKGPNLCIITNAGGPAVLATDAAIANGGSIPSLSPEMKEKLNAFLPLAWSRSNPVDILGDALPEAFGKTIETMSQSGEFDGLLVILTPQDMTEPTESAKALTACHSSKPLFASWMGGFAVREAIDILNSAGIPTYDFPDEAASTFARMWHHQINLRALYPMPEEKISLGRKEREIRALSMMKKEGEILTEEESKSLLQVYDIPIVETFKAKSPQEAVAIAERIGYPVVLKLNSQTISHKSDVGGVLLNLLTASAVEKAFMTIEDNVGKGDFDGVTVQKMIKTGGFELIVGSTIDPQFGPIILFGSGGSMVEIYRDIAIELPPLNPINARRLIAKTKIFKAFQGWRGRKEIDIDSLAALLIKFSTMIVENPWIKECDINPLLVSEQSMIVLDARVRM